jgi:hypothetical protein
LLVASQILLGSKDCNIYSENLFICLNYFFHNNTWQFLDEEPWSFSENRPKVIHTFLEFASLIGLLLYSIWNRLWLSIKALVA